ncbi:MAG TPA: GH1 family beta-glucosidase [Thermotogota bacterium]|nr:GH1 family beta-glucosidase [Thermotogota bacterium]HRW91814.1 GH1 family beta-glucosidase [Thermotogota bacterium]
MKCKDFGKDFLWGAATASYQIEGADAEQGKGPSIWTAFSHTPGRTFRGQTGDVACDHVHRLQEDLEWMEKLHCNTYRFSISWPRVLPQGKGALNEAGMDFYRRLVDGLLARGITPFVTLYHWDLPWALQEKMSGWESRELPSLFGEYAERMFRELGDRVKNWITLNEPFCSSHVSYFFGEHAPGVKDLKRSLQVAHHLLMAHGEGVLRFREWVKGGKIGLTNVSSQVEPATDAEQDRQAAFLVDQFNNGWFFLPPLTGEYPREAMGVLEQMGVAPRVEPGDMELIHNPPDFWGINYYSRNRVRFDPSAPLQFALEPGDLPRTEMGWEIYPFGLQAFLEKAHREYGGLDQYITENGMADKDVLENGKVEDIARIEYLKTHFAAAYRAMQNGVPLKGYFIWSLMDNFEWAHGFSKRFGLLYVDYENKQQRIPKASFSWFSHFLRNEREL